MRYVSFAEVLFLHKEVLAQSGGGSGIRDLGALQSALSQPAVSFGGNELYPTIFEKAAALGFSIIMNHPFIDGNKRTGHAALEVFLMLNGYEIESPIDEQERIILEVASSTLDRESFKDWLSKVIVERRR